MRVLHHAFLRCQQKEFAAMVQHEYLRQSSEGRGLPAETARGCVICSSAGSPHLDGGHVAAEQASEADGDPAATALPAARGGGSGELDGMKRGAPAVDGDGAHEHGIAKTREGPGGAVDEVDGSDALRDEVFDEIAAEDERGAETGQRFVVELREKVQVVAGAHTGDDGDETAIRRGESGEHRWTELAPELVTKLGKEAMVALFVFARFRGAGVLVQGVDGGLVGGERELRDEAIALFLDRKSVV